MAVEHKVDNTSGAGVVTTDDGTTSMRLFFGADQRLIKSSADGIDSAVDGINRKIDMVADATHINLDGLTSQVELAAGDIKQSISSLLSQVAFEVGPVKVGLDGAGNKIILSAADGDIGVKLEGSPVAATYFVNPVSVKIEPGKVTVLVGDAGVELLAGGGFSFTVGGACFNLQKIMDLIQDLIGIIGDLGGTFSVDTNLSC